MQLPYHMQKTYDFEGCCFAFYDQLWLSNSMRDVRSNKEFGEFQTPQIFIVACFFGGKICQKIAAYKSLLNLGCCLPCHAFNSVLNLLIKNFYCIILPSSKVTFFFFFFKSYTHFSNVFHLSFNHLAVPAHLKQEAVSPSHTLKLMFVFLQKVNITFLRNKLQQL